jgi:hypothetical protein
MTVHHLRQISMAVLVRLAGSESVNPSADELLRR